MVYSREQFKYLYLNSINALSANDCRDCITSWGMTDDASEMSNDEVFSLACQEAGVMDMLAVVKCKASLSEIIGSARCKIEDGALLVFENTFNPEISSEVLKSAVYMASSYNLKAKVKVDSLNYPVIEIAQ